MPIITLDKHYSRWKPPLGAEIDWAHPLARDLKSAIILNEGAGATCRDLVDGIIGTQEGTWETSPYGYVASFDSSDTHSITIDKPLGLTYPFTVIGFMNANVSLGSIGAIVGVSRSDVSNKAAYIAFYTGGQMVIYGDTTVGTSGKFVTNKQWAMVTGIFESDTSRKQWLDLSQGTTATSSVALQVSSFNRVCLGCSKQQTYYNNEHDGRILWGYIYNRALSAADQLQLYVEPFCFLK